MPPSCTDLIFIPLSFLGYTVLTCILCCSLCRSHLLLLSPSCYFSILFYFYSILLKATKKEETKALYYMRDLGTTWIFTVGVIISISLTSTAGEPWADIFMELFMFSYQTFIHPSTADASVWFFQIYASKTNKSANSSTCRLSRKMCHRIISYNGLYPPP